MNAPGHPMLYPGRPVLYIVVCATPRARVIGELVESVVRRGWAPYVIATPQAMKFIDSDALAELTGAPVRHEYKSPDAPDVLPDPDAVLVCPASFNTINKWAAGISDTLALGLITEAIGMGLPLIAAPAVNSAQAAHPAFERNVDTLRAAGVVMLYGPGIWEPAPPRSGGAPFDQELALTALDEVRDRLGSL
ncbi:flavoprotein [Nonomuraea sp. ZG12]|uniref:flavoprotein n=1 Tax=Nonomuraea sp. ZG12 TaxID=3452207 RepID=UPI003F89F2E5